MNNGGILKLPFENEFEIADGGRGLPRPCGLAMTNGETQPWRGQFARRSPMPSPCGEGGAKHRMRWCPDNGLLPVARNVRRYRVFPFLP